MDPGFATVLAVGAMLALLGWLAYGLIIWWRQRGPGRAYSPPPLTGRPGTP